MKHWTHYTRFNFGRANHLSLCQVVSDDDYDKVVAIWLSGRILGRYVSISIPWRGRLRRRKRTENTCTPQK